ncbi:hypothetical protein Vi05172_g2921 [Venturia inaequalis]|uniref:Uncharacterized protein n=1 Tax=Venturia inaequalis TaxID=5025 RepID=A0A8H3YNN7_VENIN|nr:hypothetical protein EG327_000794 [Venturia inaequalis]RDI87094.1 hypothetical protein Vi05172_g2921 [Venturia inaequalis]
MRFTIFVSLIAAVGFGSAFAAPTEASVDAVNAVADAADANGGPYGYGGGRGGGGRGGGVGRGGGRGGY